MASKLEIPVGAVFEKRLAELIWENCPDLARQTAAGRMALAIDVHDKATIKQATKSAIDSAVSQLVSPLKEAASEQLEKTSSVAMVKSGVENTIKNIRKSIEETCHRRASEALEGSLRKYWDDVLLKEIKSVSRELCEERELTKIIRERLEVLITDYLQHQLDSHKTGGGALRAAESEMVTRVADAVGKKELQT